MVFDYAEVMDVSDNCDWASELIISQTPGPYSVINDTTEVVLTATDMSGNSSQASFNINLTGDYVGIGLTDAENLRIYPNPTDGIIHINDANRTIRHLMVTNIAGIMLIEKSGFSEQDFLDLSQLKSGVYLIRIQKDDNTQIRNIIKR